jgi:hypothetical protein
MLRNALCAVAVVALSFTVARAEDIKGKITKIADGKVTITPGKFNKETKKFESEDPKTLTLAKDVKVYKIKFNKTDKKVEKEELSEGLNADAVKNITSDGVRGSVITNSDGQVTEIHIGGGRGKGGKGGKRKNKDA